MSESGAVLRDAVQGRLLRQQLRMLVAEWRKSARRYHHDAIRLRGDEAFESAARQEGGADGRKACIADLEALVAQPFYKPEPADVPELLAWSEGDKLVDCADKLKRVADANRPWRDGDIIGEEP